MPKKPDKRVTDLVKTFERMIRRRDPEPVLAAMRKFLALQGEKGKIARERAELRRRLAALERKGS